MTCPVLLWLLHSTLHTACLFIKDKPLSHSVSADWVGQWFILYKQTKEEGPYKGKARRWSPGFSFTMRTFFAYTRKRLFIPGCVQGAITRYLVGMSVCVCVCNIRCFCWLRGELYEADFRKPGIYESGRGWANAWSVFRRTPSRSGRGRRAAVNFVVCFGCGGFFCFFVSVFFLRTHTACWKYEAALSHLPLY